MIEVLIARRGSRLSVKEIAWNLISISFQKNEASVSSSTSVIYWSALLTILLGPINTVTPVLLGTACRPGLCARWPLFAPLTCCPSPVAVLAS